MQRYLITIETNCPQTVKGKEDHAMLRSEIIKNGQEVNDLLGQIGLPALTVEDFDFILETSIITIDPSSGDPYSVIRRHVDSLPGQNTLKGWDKTF